MRKWRESVTTLIVFVLVLLAMDGIRLQLGLGVTLWFAALTGVLATAMGLTLSKIATAHSKSAPADQEPLVQSGDTPYRTRVESNERNSENVYEETSKLDKKWVYVLASGKHIWCTLDELSKEEKGLVRHKLPLDFELEKQEVSSGTPPSYTLCVIQKTNGREQVAERRYTLWKPHDGGLIHDSDHAVVAWAPIKKNGVVKNGESSSS